MVERKFENVAKHASAPPPPRTQQSEVTRVPLTDDEQDKARANWKIIREKMPWLAEFMICMSEDQSFDGRRVLADATVRVFPETDEGDQR